MGDRTTISILQTTRPRFEEAKEAVAEELGEKPTQDDVVRELIEAYIGRDACGRWRDRHER